MLIADRLWIPDDSQAILWDMDGVLLDSLGLDLTVCNQLLRDHAGEGVEISKDYIRSLFAYDPADFWRLILDLVQLTHNLGDTSGLFDAILPAYNEARNSATFEVNPGILDILKEARARGIKMAVVSNNPTDDVRRIISASGIVDYFDIVLGNDLRKLQKKPAPDTYVFSTELLNVEPGKSVVIEDSVLGLQAGHSARCYTVAVATGGDSFESLENSLMAQTVYSAFQPNHLAGRFGNVTHKSIRTPNDFVSHMIEHIAWRTGWQIDLAWNNNDWRRLGIAIAAGIGSFPNHAGTGTALGMIDDGSAEVSMELSGKPAATITSIQTIDLDWFMSLRCEQLSSGEPLARLLDGLAEGLVATIDVRICSVEDPHHTWEGVFRSVGIALSRMYTPRHPEPALDRSLTVEDVTIGGLHIEKRAWDVATVSRRTAETGISVSVDFSGQNVTSCTVLTAPSIDVGGLYDLLRLLSEESGISFQVKFEAVALSSSHVVLEDTGLVIGRALKEILVLRMEHHGVNGAGSSLGSPEDLATQPIGVGVSVEGRKFLKIVPFKESFPELRKRFIIGHSLANGLFTEDLDDFLDGLAGGLEAGIVVHVRDIVEVEQGWQLIFRHLGKALKGVFTANPYRKGVPPGVKATLH